MHYMLYWNDMTHHDPEVWVSQHLHVCTHTVECHIIFNACLKLVSFSISDNRHVYVTFSEIFGMWMDDTLQRGGQIDGFGRE